MHIGPMWRPVAAESKNMHVVRTYEKQPIVYNLSRIS